MSKTPLRIQVDNVERALHKLEIKKNILLEKSISSDDPNDIIKAYSILDSLKERESGNRKSMIIDPNEFTSSFGYKDKPSSLSYGVLKNMANTPIVNAIIKTRINQIVNFCQPQKDRHSLGFLIKKRTLPGEKEEKLTKEEKKEIMNLYDFLEHCGDNFSYEGENDFDAFIRKIMRDSLDYDQMNFEIILNKKGEPYSFSSVDASTIRIADSFDDETYEKYINNRYGMPFQNRSNVWNERKKEIKGYYPSYIQVYEGQPIVDFYPWELCFAIRNPSSSIRKLGYGTSENEDLIKTITALLWGEEYNRRFFKQGSVPRGLLKVSGSIPPDKLSEFKQQWNATMRGVYNAWRTPIVEAEKVDWVDFQKSNKDMEWTNWMEFQIKIACSIFLIDPAEINFPLQGSSGQSYMFEGNNEARLAHSKDKGLFPIIKFLQKKLNRYLIHPKSGNKYELIFLGIDSMTPDKELEMHIKEATNLKTLNEVRQLRGDSSLGELGDIVLNSIYLQNKNITDQMKQQQEQQGQGQNDEQGYSNQEQSDEIEEAINPFEKAFDDYIKTLNKK